MLRIKLVVVCFALLTFGLSSLGQSRPAPSRTQTARQALIEMIVGGQEAQLKHLTVEVQQELTKPGGKLASQYLASMGVMVKQSGNELKSFDTGSILFTASDSTKAEKVEVVVDSDDLSGDLDTLQLSIHAYQDGKEQEDEVMSFAPRVSVEMKKQDNIWRLNNLVVSINVPVGNPKLFQQFRPDRSKSSHTTASLADGGAGSKPEEPRTFDPQTTLRLMSFAEAGYAREHPDSGFACSLTDLLGAKSNFGEYLEPQLTAAGTNGFRIVVSGCQGIPAGSYQLVIEPISAAAGIKAYCTDATLNVRFSEDGRGSTCLGAGKPVPTEQIIEGGMVGFSLGSSSSKPQK